METITEWVTLFVMAGTSLLVCMTPLALAGFVTWIICDIRRMDRK